MNIALVSKLWEKSDTNSTGGTGMKVGNLAEGLIKRGHKVTIFGTGDSKTKANLVSIIKKPFSPQNPYSEIKEYLNISKAFQSANKFDIINCHTEHKGLLFSGLVKTPIIYTIGYGQFFNDELLLLKEYKKENFIAESKAIKKKFIFLNFKKIIYNGIDLKRYPFNQKPKDYFLFFARMSPDKAPDLAIRAAKKADVKLILAGKINPADKEYLDKKVFPFIDNKKITYLGDLNFKDKLLLLKNAKALIHPHTYFEAFGIMLIESLACGTPVITSRNGASPEIIKNGKNGYLINNEKEIIKAIKSIKLIDRKKCRKSVEKNFSIEKMTEEYEKIYKQIIKSKK